MLSIKHENTGLFLMRFLETSFSASPSVLLIFSLAGFPVRAATGRIDHRFTALTSSARLPLERTASLVHGIPTAQDRQGDLSTGTGSTRARTENSHSDPEGSLPIRA